MTELTHNEAPKKVTVEDTSKQEMEEVLKIIQKNDYKIVEQLAQTPSKISMIYLLLCSEAHAQCDTVAESTVYIGFAFVFANVAVSKTCHRVFFYPN